MIRVRISSFSYFILVFALLTGRAFTVRAEAFPAPVVSAQIENFYVLSSNVFSGATPENEEAFRELKKRGIKTIISVDGAKPDAMIAGKLGLRYVHLPFGYDTAPTNRQVELIQAARTLPGPFYIHCHHGKHRGPTAAAIICLGTEGWNTAAGVEWMKQAGTATNYAGLYKSVAEFAMPSAASLASVTAFPEHAAVSTVVEAMVMIDAHYEHLKLLQKAEFKPVASHPDLVPSQEALLLHEQFKEMLRMSGKTDAEPEYLQEWNKAEQAGGALSSLLLTRDFAIAEANKAFQQISESCISCHRKYRN